LLAADRDEPLLRPLACRELACRVPVPFRDLDWLGLLLEPLRDLAAVFLAESFVLCAMDPFLLVAAFPDRIPDTGCVKRRARSGREVALGR
jgi:hypothetical protein